MTLDFAIQKRRVDLENVHFHVLLASSGFEKRATHFSSNFNCRNSQVSKIAFLYKDVDVNADAENFRQFTKLGFEIVGAFENRSEELTKVLSAQLKSFQSEKELNILVDYSCMTKVWYAGILRFFSKWQGKTPEVVNLYFVYTQAKFEPPQASSPNYSASLIDSFHSLDSPQKEVAFIIGLGYAENKATGLIEYLHIDYENCYIFKTGHESSAEFDNLVATNNADLLRRVPEGHIFDYPLSDLSYTDSLLTTLVLHFRNEGKRVLIAPLGPKPFALLALLLCTKYDFLNVYRITEANAAKGSYRFADDSKPLLIYQAVFTSSTKD